MPQTELAPTIPPTYDACLQLIWALLADGQVAAAETLYAALANETPPRPIRAVALHTAGGLLATALGQADVAAARWREASRLAAALLATSGDLHDRAEAARFWDDCQRFLQGDLC